MAVSFANRGVLASSLLTVLLALSDPFTFWFANPIWASSSAFAAPSNLRVCVRLFGLLLEFDDNSDARVSPVLPGC